MNHFTTTSSNRARALKVLALAAAAAVVLRPVLYFDHLDDFALLGLLRWQPMSQLLRECASPVYFRPLCAPIFIVFYKLFGAWFLPLRCAMLGLHLGAALFLGLSVFEISESEAAGMLAGFLYAVGPTHWDLFAAVLNFGQAGAHAFLWAALWLWCRKRPNPTSAALAAATALLLKEDAIVFAPLAVAARRAQGRPLSRGDKFAAWIPGGAYLAVRLALAHWLPLTGLIAKARLPRLVLAREALEALMGGLASPLRAAGAIDAATLWIGGSFCVLAGVILRDALAVENRSRWLPTAAFGIIAFLTGLAPYAPFNALAYSDPHRWALAWAGLAIALAGAATAPRHAATALAVGLWTAWFSLGTALTLRRPERRHLLFASQKLMDKLHGIVPIASAELFPRLCPGDDVIVRGFDGALDIPAVLSALSPVRIHFSETPEPGGHCWLFSARADDGARVEEIK